MDKFVKLITSTFVDRLEALEKENARKEKMEKWGESRDKLNSLFKGIKGKFNKLKARDLPKKPKDIQQHQKMTRVSWNDDLWWNRIRISQTDKHPFAPTTQRTKSKYIKSLTHSLSLCIYLSTSNQEANKQLHQNYRFVNSDYFFFLFKFFIFYF